MFCCERSTLMFISLRSSETCSSKCLIALERTGRNFATLNLVCRRLGYTHFIVSIDAHFMYLINSNEVTCISMKALPSWLISLNANFCIMYEHISSCIWVDSFKSASQILKFRMHCGVLLVAFTNICDECGINWNKIFLQVPPVLVLMRLLYFLQELT